MPWHKRLSIRRKLALMVMGVGSIAAIVSCTLFGSSIWVTHYANPADSHPLIKVYTVVVTIILVSSLLLAFILSILFQRWIAAPILSLTRMMRLVSNKKDYSVRADKISQDEIGELAGGFNRMLQDIETHETALRHSNEALRREIAERRKAENDLRFLTETLEQRIAERTAAAESANRAKSEFLTNVSHELRTPLNSVIGFTNLLLKNKDGTLRADDTAYLERILANGRHLLGLINQILDLSKIETRQSDVTLAHVDLKAMIRDILTECESQAYGRPVKLILSTPEQVSPFRTDACKLRQILLNLISNGVKFTESGYVRVGIVTEPDTHYPVRIEVTDTGIGIPLQEQAAIFEAFQLSENTFHRKHKGTGLGLTITMALCRLLGYHLDVRSEPGRGSTFSVWLSSGPPPPSQREEPNPSQPGSAAPVDTTPGPDPLQGRTILVVGDEEESLLFLTRLLESMDCTVLPAASGEEGLHLAQQASPDAIALDLRTPGIDGCGILKTLKTKPHLEKLPVLILTGTPLTPAEKLHLSGSATAILEKAGDWRKDLRKTLGSLLSKSGN